MGEEEEKENPCAAFPKDKRFGDWAIVCKLDEGGFGQVYKVRHVRIHGKMAALKAEPNDVEGGSAIKLEMNVLTAMHANGEKIHVPTVFHAAKHKRFCYMVMMLLGENLKHLKSENGGNLSVGTWSRIAIQCLYGIKLVHDYGFIHRDIKPNNFVMGHRDDPERCRIVHILDFGLTRSYATKKADGTWLARRARGTAEFRGTLRYCSPNVHRNLEQGRADDLWGLLYVLIEVHSALPWQLDHDKRLVEAKKLNLSHKALMMKMPIEVQHLPETLDDLNCYSRPDYSKWFLGFRKVMEKEGVYDEHWRAYDWEKEPPEVYKQKYGSRPPPKWQTDAAFFDSDPIKIDGPPLNKKTMTSRTEQKTGVPSLPQESDKLGK